MKFTVKEDPHFKCRFGTFEAGNTHNSETLGIPDADVLRWHRAGWVDAEGETPCERNVHHTEIKADDVVHAGASEVK